eukprot:gene4631-14823_t
MENHALEGRLNTGSGRAGYVDDTLFGPSSPKHSPSSPKLPTIKRSESSEKTSSPMRSSLRNSADVEEIESQRHALAEKRSAQQAVSKARKERMLKLEEEARKHAPMTESDQIRQVHDNATRSRADRLIEEQKDEVKHMNQMMLYSKCVTIRDAQIEEKRTIMQENDDELRKQDMMMEVNRIRSMEQYEAVEAARADERSRGARVLEEQIDERKRERLRQEELRDQERVAMLREIERLKEQELQLQIEKKIQGKKLMEEVAEANEEQIQRKAMMKVRERDEEARINEYVMAKMMKEQEVQAEKERIALEKEMEMGRMRAKQEKAADRQAELDELRARRYQEAKEREWRARERAAVERAATMQAELMDARKAQKDAALTQRADMAKVEHEEFVRVLTVNRVKEQGEMTQTIQRHDVNSKYRDDLQAQILSNEEKEKKKHQEGLKLRAEHEAEKAKLLEIKARKLQQLEQIGVPEKWTVSKKASSRLPQYWLYSAPSASYGQASEIDMSTRQQPSSIPKRPNSRSIEPQLSGR